MEAEDYLKRTPDLLTNRYKVMMLMIIIFGIEFAWLLRDSEITQPAKNGIVIGIFVAGGFISIFLTVLAKKLDDDILKEREKIVTNFQIKMETEVQNIKGKRIIEDSISVAYEMIRDWIDNPPSENQIGIYPFSNDVEVELKILPTGDYCAVLHVEGRQSEEYPF